MVVHASSQNIIECSEMFILDSLLREKVGLFFVCLACYKSICNHMVFHLLKFLMVHELWYAASSDEYVYDFYAVTNDDNMMDPDSAIQYPL